MARLRISAALTAAMSLLCAAAVPTASAASADALSTRVDLSKYTNQQLSWGDCSFDTDGVPTQCAMMTVPRDWANPEAGVDLQVYVSKVAATGDPDDYQGIVLLNPGGPGGQGTTLAPLIAQLQPSVNAAYDVIGMDPRGTGQAGAPGDAGVGMTCEVPIDRLPEGFLDARDRSRESIKAHQQVPRAIAEACQSEAATPYITTWQTAHDMDLFRHLAGAERLNYIGYSYGSWLGAKYASLFPEHTGRIVLDSNVDWQGRLQADFEDFPRMGQRHADQLYIPWLTRIQPELFGETVAEAKAVIESGRAKAPELGLSPDLYDSLLIGNGSELNWVLVLLLLNIILQEEGEAVRNSIAALPAALRTQADTVSKERFGVPATKLTRQILKAHDFGLDVVDYAQVPLTRFSVACGDQRTRSTRWYKALSDRQGPKYPYFGWQYGLGEVCGPWTDPPRERLPKLPASVRDNVLVVQGEFDPQTSYEQAMSAVRKARGVNVLRIDDAAFHGQYTIDGNPCVDGVVNTYLLYGSVTPNSICPTVPLPGEDEVYPVHGPVDDYLDRHRGHRLELPRLAIVDETLRHLLGDRISKTNSAPVMG